MNLNPPPLQSPLSQGGNILRVWSLWFTSVFKILTAINPTISDDNGDKDITITADKSALLQRFNTPLTTNRTVTLSTVGVYRGARFRVLREAGATGASTLDVGGLRTLAVDEWCDVAYSGSAWILIGF